MFVSLESETAVICSIGTYFVVSLKSAPRYINAMRLGCKGLFELHPHCMNANTISYFF